MICYKDKIYCGSKTDNHTCEAVITEEELKHAQEIGLPIAYIKFCEEKEDE